MYQISRIFAFLFVTYLLYLNRLFVFVVITMYQISRIFAFLFVTYLLYLNMLKHNGCVIQNTPVSGIVIAAYSRRNAHPFSIARFAAWITWSASTQLVTPPTPPGTGVMAATTGTRNVSIQVTYGQTDARNVYGMINSMRRNLSDAWYWDANNYTKTYCNNLQPLTYDYALEQVAMKRAAEIALSYSHTRPNGTNYYTSPMDSSTYYRTNICSFMFWFTFR